VAVAVVAPPCLCRRSTDSYRANSAQRTDIPGVLPAHRTRLTRTRYGRWPADQAVAFQDIRLEYVTGTLKGLGLAAAGSRAMVVGSGRGLLAGGLARLGFSVLTVDPSARKVQA
jgi:2-polyprenyl-3-methyl-5-hydroxy-6-metoxy-1,4-benzoquinol methylase